MKLSLFAQDQARAEIIEAAQLINPYVADAILDGSGRVRGWLIEEPASEGWIVRHADHEGPLWFYYATEALEWIRANA